MKTSLLIYVCLPVLLLGQVQTQGSKSYETRRLNDAQLHIDGKLNESAWNTVSWGGGDFLVRQPNEGEQPAYQTQFKILYDANHLYVGIRAFDDEPALISRRKSRRDRFEGDWLEINIDSYFDKQTAFSFTISASGVKGDEFISDNGENWDASWDPVWFGEAAIDSQGWTAEMKIPLSQLRYGNRENHVWGIQVNRLMFRRGERSSWIFIPQSSRGWVHYFGELHGINGIRAQRQVELLPYTVGKQQYLPEAAGNPFATGSKSNLSLGLDGKIGLTSDLIMDFTINPDFGQVEADPSEVNLTAFETFFQEKRPFFIEGRNIFRFQVTDAAWGGSYSSDNLFYSRRIGRRPQHSPDIEDDAFADVPASTNIIGALKISGKTKNGWSVGFMESVTAKENADIDLNGNRRQETVEPATNYFVGRVRKDLNNANMIFGAMFTAVNRNLDSQELRFLHRAAYTGGVDFEHNLKHKTYYISGNLIFSQVRGDTAAIVNTQRASAHYYQRPDADHLTLDSTRTSLSGHGGTLKFGKRGNFKYQAGVTWRSPGIELNDIGFLMRADEVNQWAWANYRVSKPLGIFNTINLNVNTKSTWDFSGNRLGTLVNHNSNYLFRNFWSTGFSITHEFDQVSNSALRGGPSMKFPGNTSFNMWVGSDNRKKFVAEIGTWQLWGKETHTRGREYWLWTRFQPSNSISMTVNPFYNTRRNDLQYIDTIDGRYLFGSIDQKTAGFTLRLDYSITPTLTVEYYGSPFISAGAYRDFKRINAPAAERYGDRFMVYPANRLQYDAENEEFGVDENGDGQADFTFSDPDFNFRDFNSNLVIRWEYSPGSTLFLVWSQARSSSITDGRFSFRDDVRDLFRSEANNVFLVKFSRWFSL